MAKSTSSPQEQLLRLQSQLASIGLSGTKFVPRMEGATSIGDQSKTSAVDDLAKKIPCVPYSAVALGEDNKTLYITYDTNANLSKNQLLDDIKSSKEYTQLDNENPGLSIEFVDFNRQLGDLLTL